MDYDFQAHSHLVSSAVIRVISLFRIVSPTKGLYISAALRSASQLREALCQPSSRYPGLRTPCASMHNGGKEKLMLGSL